MKKQISSHELNTIMSDAQASLMNAQKELGLLKEMVTNRLDILEDEELWSQSCLQSLGHLPATAYLSVPVYEKSDGVFSHYYFDVYPALVKTPLNVFNITSTQTTFFREDVTLEIIHNNGTTEDVTDILKHDSLKTTYFHRRFTEKEVTFLLSIKDYQKPLGASRFNMLEIDGFMPGSFKLKRLSLIYGEEEIINYENFNKLGKNRILLEEKKPIYQIEMVFELLNPLVIEQKTYYPFALKHLYLLDADFKDDSHVIVPIESEQLITLIQDECIISSNRGVETTTLKALGIEIYAHYKDNQLYMPITISNAYEIYDIPLQLHTLYAKIPLKGALTSIGFSIKTK